MLLIEGSVLIKNKHSVLNENGLYCQEPNAEIIHVMKKKIQICNGLFRRNLPSAGKRLRS